MKKLILYLSLLASLTILKPVFATDSTPSAASKSANIDQKAQDILNKVTSQVAQISDQTRRTYHGKIKSVGTSSYLVSTPDGNKTLTTNDVTTFYKIRAGSRAEISFTSLKVGDDIVAMGTIDPQTGDMTARQIIAKIKRTIIIGPVSAIDKDIYTITDTSNQTQKINLADSLGFRKVVSGKISAGKQTDIKVGSTVFVLSYIPSPDAGAISALKVLSLTK